MGEPESVTDNKGEELSEAGQEAAEVDANREPAPDSIAAFAVYLSETLDEEKRRRKLRVLKRGIFVHEELIDHIADVYTEWINSLSGNKKLPREKAFKRLFGSELPDFYYIVEGKQALPGVLAEGEIPKPEKLDITVHHGSLLDTKDYLHPRDPLFENSKGISSELDPVKGLKITLEAGKRSYLVNTAILTEFRELAANNNRLKREFPRMVKSVRFVPEALRHLLRKSRHISERRKVLIPASFRKERNIEIRRVGAIYFLIDGSGNIVKCYEIRGKNQAVFVRSELNALLSKGRNRKLGNFRFAGMKERYLGTLPIHELPLKVSRKILNQFIGMLEEHQITFEKLPERYTVRDAVEALLAIIEKGSWLLERDVPRRILEQVREKSNYLKSGEWIITVTRPDLISALYSLKAPRKIDKQKTPQAQKQKQETR
ncbi:MAG: hypothetical protein D6719_12190 [Candidatus Dadabacteria bacterium]|nr:MAG: hypothetical protein D6719_12190 [Candidatus Dadabacteria bacterium]